MAIHSAKNLYPGINPHLNSALQKSGGGWTSFHSEYLTDIRKALDSILPDTYYVARETSLQIGTYDPIMDFPLARPALTRPDVAIFRRGSGDQQTPSTSALSSPTPTLTISVAETIDDDEDIGAVVIYHLEANEFPGKPVTRIELLSPANKPPGSHYKAYMQKRGETLYAGIRLIEIDYLHERHPILAQIQSYVTRRVAAFPYHIIVNDPRPSVDDGLTDVFSFGIFDLPPTIAIPLDNGDVVTIDFGAIYHETFESSRFFREVLVDYTQEPVNFTSYTEADQQAIQEHMAQIAAEQT